jgi:hypothetical protein
MAFLRALRYRPFALLWTARRSRAGRQSLPHRPFVVGPGEDGLGDGMGTVWSSASCRRSFVLVGGGWVDGRPASASSPPMC